MPKNNWKFDRPRWDEDHTYSGIRELSHRQIAWEFLRRNRNYHRYFLASQGKEGMEERKNALANLREDAPLIWFVPKKGASKNFKVNEKLGEFIRRVRLDSPRSVKKMLRVRPIDPSLFMLTRFVDPNETPLKDESVFDVNIFDFVTYDEGWEERNRNDFLELEECDVLFKVDLRYSLEKMEAILKKQLHEIKNKMRGRGSEALGIKDRKKDRVALLRAFDARREKAKPSQRNSILFPNRGKAVNNLKKAYFENIRSAKKLVRFRYRYLAYLS